jgi:hypothetical protein
VTSSSRGPGRRGVAAVAIAAGLLAVGLALRDVRAPEVAPTPAPERLVAAPDPPDDPSGGGFSDGSGDARTVPPPRAGVLPASAADDGVLQVLVVGDEQALGEGAWPEAAVATLTDRLKAAPAPWNAVRIELSSAGAPGWTAGHAWAWLLAQKPGPELILVSLGWNDGRAGAAAGGPPPVSAEERQWYLDESAALSALRHVDGGGGFYLDGADVPRLKPMAHLRALDSMGAKAAELGAALVYVEQPILRPTGPRTVFASAAMRPQPWILLTTGLEAHPDVASLFGEPPLLTPAGHALVGRFVGEGLVATVLGAR